MRNGLKVFDVDTHVDPSYNVLVKHVEPGFRPRLDELKPYLRMRKIIGKEVATIACYPYPFDRWPGERPSEEPVVLKAGGAGAIEGGRVTRRTMPPRIAPRAGVSDEDSAARLADMDMEGRDIDLLIPSTWATSMTALEDASLAEGLYRAYHHYMRDYCSAAPARLKGMILVPGRDIEWAVAEVERFKNDRWVACVWPLLPEGMPIDDPRLDPLWAAMNDAHLPILHHSFFYEPPYFPGYRDIWGNVCIARTAAHPWSAARLLSYLIVGRVFDRFPNLNCVVSEVGHGWLPHWAIRLDYMTKYLGGTVPDLAHDPIDYVRMGRFRCGAEPFEGPLMTKACIDILGENVLMHQSDYPHGECNFPDTAQNVIDWPIWRELGPDALRKHMSGNAEAVFRLL